MSQRFSGLVKILRRLGMVLMVVCIALVWRRYDFEQLDEARAIPLKGRMQEGSFLIFTKIQDSTEIGTGSIVEAKVKVPASLQEQFGATEGLILSEIRAEPGDEISFLDALGDETEILVNGGRTYARMNRMWSQEVAPERRLTQGKIPDGYFLILNPHAASPAVDSRRAGLIPRDTILRKVGTLR